MTGSFLGKFFHYGPVISYFFRTGKVTNMQEMRHRGAPGMLYDVKHDSALHNSTFAAAKQMETTAVLKSSDGGKSGCLYFTFRRNEK